MSDGHVAPPQRSFLAPGAPVVVVPYAPHAKQKLFHASRARWKVLACGARFGKDRASVNEMIKLLVSLWEARRGKPSVLTPLVHAWVVAPTYALTNQDFREFEHFLPAKLIYKLNRGGAGSIQLCGGDVLIEFKSADKPESLVSVGLDAVLVTEAGMIAGLAWEQSIQPRLVSPGRAGFALINGTPKGMHSWFHTLYLLGQDPAIRGIDSWRFPTFDNPHIDPADLEALRGTMPERWFSQEILAEWLDDAGGVFRGVRDPDVCFGVLEPPVPKRSYTMGVDLAKTLDFSVLTVMDLERRRVVAWERFNQLDWTTQKQRITQLCRRYNEASILLDSTGLGDPILDDLAAAGLPVSGYKFTSQSKRPLIDNLSIGIEQKQLSYPDLPQMINEMQAYEYHLTPAGNVTMSAPENFHDDCVISLALCYWHACQGQRLGLHVLDMAPQGAAFDWQRQRLHDQ